MSSRCLSTGNLALSSIAILLHDLVRSSCCTRNVVRAPNAGSIFVGTPGPSGQLRDFRAAPSSLDDHAPDRFSALRRQHHIRRLQRWHPTAPATTLYANCGSCRRSASGSSHGAARSRVTRSCETTCSLIVLPNTGLALAHRCQKSLRQFHPCEATELAACQAPVSVPHGFPTSRQAWKRDSAQALSACSCANIRFPQLFQYPARPAAWKSSPRNSRDVSRLVIVVVIERHAEDIRTHRMKTRSEK